VLAHRWPGRAFEATLVSRPNRFLAVCRVGDLEVEAHVPDRGRCLDLLVPGREVALVAAEGPLRRTRFTCLLARSPPRAPRGAATGAWVSLDPAGAPRLVSEALRLGMLAPLRGLLVQRREVVVGASRIDLLLTTSARSGRDGAARPEGRDGGVLCEVKSVGAARDGVALFPDAPTERGLRHVRLLTRLSRRQRCAVVLCAQRSDVRAIAPDEEIDPAFARALRTAAKKGVIVCGLRCAATLAGVKPLGEIPVLL
jgi:sugar fermentation stimulation protein A